MTRRRLPLFAASLVAILLTLVACALPGQRTEGDRALPSPRPLQQRAYTATPTRAPSPTPDLAALLAHNPMPPRDYTSPLDGGTNRGSVQAWPAPRSFQRGDRERFWIGDLDSGRMYQITATLHMQTDLVQMWVEQGLEVDQDELQYSAKFFEEQIYPINHEYFSHQGSSSIEDAAHLVILNADVRGAAGYFSLANAYPREVNPYSNEREMFVINAAAVQPSTRAYHATLAHEFQHMLHWHLDRNEEAWLNEGASELAEELNGFSVSRPAVRAFERQPDVQLNAWTSDPDTLSAHYGASHLFLRYTLSRFGAETLRAIVRNPQNGIQSFDAPLKEHDPSLTFDALFADWIVANVLEQDMSRDGHYGYRDMNVKVEIEKRVQSYPHTIEGDVHQYGADYIELLGCEKGSSLQITFRGTSTVGLVPNTPTSGRFQWWSNRGDASHSYLERTFDLGDITTATLSFNLWHDIEKGWDYAHIRASTDGGRTWQLLQGTQMQSRDGGMYALGPGYTGKSGVADNEAEDVKAQWVREHLDLSPFCGQEVTIRFDYVTDDAVNGPGLCVDDFHVDPLGFHDDVESGGDGWHAEGFIRHNNRLPQGYIVQVVEFSSSPRIRSIPVNAQGRGEIVIEAFGDKVPRALLIVSATAPVTREPASYRVSLEEFP